MGERVFKPTATKMATISSNKAASATRREEHLQVIRPSKPSRASTADAVCEWSGPNRPNISRDIHISARPSPHNDVSASTAEKWSMGINRSHPVGGPGRGTTAPVEEKEQLEWPRNPPWHLKTSSQECHTRGGGNAGVHRRLYPILHGSDFSTLDR
jgi:hypothetical protein